ncbi:N-alpha-acetyltransferase 35, NatC auxiliary subunit [Entomortierella parvispora]|uniref:N-alpha-acetyltransferase 35, NatC auxiliary subunit n=1 Tax=Entomortierella parvispora TaxID=205924 RepID=A0A9P3HK58_9FUNG|nr:N-alpha-acetyltransferase 35, NatC auxiliary subunit [Entomortierella parvispora]
MDQEHGIDSGSAQHIESKAARLSLSNGGSTYPFEDVTSLLDVATKGMKVGQLVQVPTFSLFDAMCAIVIMDPKMDTGMTVDDPTTTQYDVNRLIDPKEFIWIFDNILIGKMTWLSGHALSQTLLTSCYVLRLMEIDLETEMTEDSLRQQSLKDPRTSSPPPQFAGLVLKSCVLAIVKSCALIWTEMRKAQVYEEEDFMTNKFGASFYDSFPLGSLIAMLDRAEVWMEDVGARWIHVVYEAEEATRIVAGIMSRISYSRLSFMALYQVVGVNQVTAPKCAMFPQALDRLAMVRDQVKDLRSTSDLGIKLESAFDHTVHRKLVTNTPPRAIALLTMTETFDQLEEMCKDLLFIGQAFSFPDSTSLVNFFIQFGRKKPTPGAFSRSILQTVLYDERIIMGTRPVHRVVLDHIRETLNPPAWIFDNFEYCQSKLDGVPTPTPESAAASGLEFIPELPEDEDDENRGLSLLKRQINAKAVMFVEKATKPFVDTLQIMGQNPSRQRRNLRKIVLLWETLQTEAEGFDEEIHFVEDEVRRLDAGADISKDELEQPGRMKRYYFVSWTYQMKLWVMEWMLLLGAQLELYSLFEYPMIYSFVDCVFETHAQHARRIRYILAADAEEEKELQERDARALKKKNKNKKKKKKKKTSLGQNTLDLEEGEEGEGDGEEDTMLATATSSSSTLSNASQSASAQKSSASSLPLRNLRPAIEVTELMTIAQLGLNRGVYQIMCALIKVGHMSLRPPHLESHGLNDLRTLFEHRFKAFRELASPELLTFEEFERRTRCEGVDALDILAHATERFNETASFLEQLQGVSAADARIELCENEWRLDVKSMAKLCIASKISIAAIQKDGRFLELREFTIESRRKKALQSAVMAKGKSKKPVAPVLLKDTLQGQVLEPGVYKAPKRHVQLDWKYHPWWPAISLS